VNCRDFTRELASSAPPSPELTRHAAECASCRELLTFDRSLRSRPLLQPLAMSEALCEAVAFTAPSRRFSWVRRGLPPLVAVLVLSALALLLAPRPDWAAVPWSTLLVVFLGLLGAFVAALALLLLRNRVGDGNSAVMRTAFPALALGVFLGVSGFAHETIPEGAYPPRAIQVFLSREVAPALGGWVRHLPCSLLGLALGVGMTSLVMRSASRVTITSPRASGAVCGSAAGLAAALVLFLFCPVHLAIHQLGVHAIPLLVCGALGFKAGLRSFA
jgi:hypothetical protein